MESLVQPKYSIVGLDKWINYVTGFVFRYRMLFILLFLIAIGYGVYEAVLRSADNALLKNIAVIATYGSVVIGVFYAVLNYEHKHQKDLYDIRFAKCAEAYNAICEWHRPAMVDNLKTTKQLFETKKHLILENKAKDFYEELEQNDEARAALIAILNYFESLAVGINQGILDELFVKRLFRTLMMSYFNDYSFYIMYKRKYHNAPTIWLEFTRLADNWQKGLSLTD